VAGRDVAGADPEHREEAAGVLTGTQLDRSVVEPNLHAVVPPYPGRVERATAGPLLPPVFGQSPPLQ
jgi:hypothetical protein